MTHGRLEAERKVLEPLLPDMDPGDLLLILENLIRGAGSGRNLFVRAVSGSDVNLRGRHSPMSQHTATISWKDTGTEFMQGRFSRAHTWAFDGGLSVPASASPAVVRPPLSDPAAVDPEEAFVASISSCHMLTFLHLARKAGFQVVSYDDAAVGEMTKNEKGVPFISTVALNPRIVYGGDKTPSADDLARLHHDAHEQCFIAQSVKTEITVNDPPKS